MRRPPIRIERYSTGIADRWNRFVSTAKNGTFLFLRSYMDYHRDRFDDHSLVVSRGSDLIAVLPANDAGSGTIVSHQGLTYGGLVVQPDATLRDVLGGLRECLIHLQQEGFARLVLKRLPRHFSRYPDDEIDYALFLLGSRLLRRDCALVLPCESRVPFRKSRRHEVALAMRQGVQYVEEQDLGRFWQEILIPRLDERYGKQPVHTLEEITRLAGGHPGSIRQFSAYLEDKILAGATIYETPEVAHAQYIAVSRAGQEVGALDGLIGWLIGERYAQKPYFDFGTSSLDDGKGINQGLLFWKEGFGARSSIHEVHEIEIAGHGRLDPLLT